jgi:uncharacterized membrane protein (DUF2068 family)
MPQPKPKNPHRGLRVIAILKFAKGVALGVGLGLFRLINPNVSDLAQRIATHLRIDPENYYLRQAIAKLADVSPRTLHNLGLLSLFFSVDLIVEGVGLWYNQTWAKYLVLVATGVFLPLEVYSGVRLFSWEKLVLFAINLTVVAYIAAILAPRRQDRGPAPAG